MKFLSLGSLNIDRVYHVDHIVKAGETISCTGSSMSAGGKGANQSAALAKSGVSTYFAGKIGRDGTWILDLLSSYGVDVSRTIVSDSTGTGEAIIQVDASGQNSIIIIAGGNREFTSDDIDGILSGFAEGDVIVLQNEINRIGEIMEKASEIGMRIAFNPSPFEESLLTLPLGLVDFFFLNEIEAGAIIGGSVLKTDGDFRAAAERLYAMFPGRGIVITAGRGGAYYRDSSGLYFSPIIDLPAADTTGAGDTFLGYFLSSICTGKSGQEALDTASRASAIAVSRQGAMEAIPFIGEVESFDWHVQ